MLKAFNAYNTLLIIALIVIWAFYFFSFTSRSSAYSMTLGLLAGFIIGMGTIKLLKNKR